MGKRLLDLADHLHAQGVDVAALRPLQAELDLVQHPGAVRSLTQRALDAAKRQWGHVVGEARESRQLLGLLIERARNGSLSPEETEQVKEQLSDMFKLVPASIIAAVNGSLPVPGTGLLTPLILQKLHLLPSRWREAHVLDELHRQAERLRAAGRLEAAQEVEALQHELEHEADARAAAAEQRWLLAHWDADGNGVLDDDELELYRREVTKLRDLQRSSGPMKRWFVSYDGQVLGPLRFAEVAGLPEPVGVLVCFDGKSGWVALSDVVPPAR
jgi:hypothetical protein